MELFLNWLGRQVDSKKPRDSLAKTPGRTGILGSDLLDLDLAAQVKTVRDLILRVDLGSSGQD